MRTSTLELDAELPGDRGRQLGIGAAGEEEQALVLRRRSASERGLVLELRHGATIYRGPGEGEAGALTDARPPA
jgi:hypothetical protein